VRRHEKGRSFYTPALALVGLLALRLGLALPPAEHNDKQHHPEMVPPEE
jgi:hypothetical protein